MRALQFFPILAALLSANCRHDGTAPRPQAEMGPGGHRPAAPSAALAAGQPPPESTPARHVSPASGAVLMGGRPRLRFLGPAGTSIELSRAPNFDGASSRLQGEGESVPEQPLAQGRWFWRVVAPGQPSTNIVWNFEVAGSAGRPLSSGAPGGPDYDGDGQADVGLPGAIASLAKGGREPTIKRLAVEEPRPALLKPEPNEPELQWGRPNPLGDVDGDGRTDASVVLMRRALSSVDARVPVRLWLAQRAPEAAPIASTELRVPSVPAGDVNGDGFADFANCSAEPRRCKVHAGAPKFRAGATWTLDGCASLVPVDADDDGFGDLWCVRASGQLGLYRGGPLGPEQSPGHTIEPMTPEPALLAADVNQDGFGDLLVGDARSASLWLVAGGPAVDRLKPQLLGRLGRNAVLKPGSWCYLPPSLRRPGAIWARTGAQSIATVAQLSAVKFSFPGTSRTLFDQTMTIAGIEANGDVDGDNAADVMVISTLNLDGSHKFLLQTGTDWKRPLELKPPWTGADVGALPER